ncbi:MAG TPA: T9SS type A sorting domain-containing protein, partial [Ignavibacteria bacterium]|nr:T9SS type A sorting domain-containing protein [Ignavibacteria bacterium]
NGDFYRVSFINENTGYTASTRAAYKTTNFGISWDSVGRVTPLNFDVTSIEFCNENTGWAGTQAPVYKTTNGGRDWIEQFVTGVVYSISAHNDSLVWTCGNAGRIWHTTTGGICFVNNISSVIPDNFKLFQNYPNPFNGQTKISFSIKQSDIYNLEIYNSIGQKVLVVFNRQFIPGTYEPNIDANTLGSGIHLYKLNGSKNSITK